MNATCTMLLGTGLSGPNAHARQAKYNRSTSVNRHMVAGENTERTLRAHGNHSQTPAE